MSIEALNYVSRMHPSRIKGIPRSVLKELADFADERNTCWPSVETLCRRTSWSERSVRDALRVLEQLGVLTTIKRHRTTPRYHLNLDPELTQPFKGAPRAPLSKSEAMEAEDLCETEEQIEDVIGDAVKGARGAPLNDPAPGAAKGAGNVEFRGQEAPFKGARGAPKPPENHQRTTRGEGARARATPLPPDWKASTGEIALAAGLGLDPARVAERFRLHFRHTGAVSADWSARWQSWCREDAEKGRAAIPAPVQPVAVAEAVPDADGLDSAGRTWVQNWDRKRAAGESTTTIEAMMRNLCPAALRVVERRRAGQPEARAYRDHRPAPLPAFAGSCDR